MDPKLWTILSPLPRKTIKTIIQYQPGISISCLLPGGNRKISIYGRESLIKSPPMIWKQEIQDRMKNPSLAASIGRTGKFKGYKVKLARAKKESYFLTEIPHQNCWGGVKYPKTLREANTRYWASGFHTRKFGSYYSDLSSRITGDKNLIFGRDVQAILISNDPQYHDLFSDHIYPITTISVYTLKPINSKIVILPLKEEGENWIFTSKDITYQIKQNKKGIKIQSVEPPKHRP